MRNENLRRAVITAMLIGVGLFLPSLTAPIPEVGKMLLPMHLPVLLCGLVCGWQYGLVCGLVTPLVRSLFFTQPALYPDAVAMMAELAAYGVSVALLFALFCRLWERRLLPAVYASLVGAMLIGRVVMGMTKAVLFLTLTKTYTWELFVTAAFARAVPGIVAQLVLVPAIILALHRAGLFRLPGRQDASGA